MPQADCRKREETAPRRGGSVVGASLPHMLIVLTLSVFRSLPLLSDLRGTLSGARSRAPSAFSQGQHFEGAQKNQSQLSLAVSQVARDNWSALHSATLWARWNSRASGQGPRGNLPSTPTSGALSIGIGRTQCMQLARSALLLWQAPAGLHVLPHWAPELQAE